MAGRPRKIQPEVKQEIELSHPIIEYDKTDENGNIYHKGGFDKSPVITNKLLNFADFTHISDTLIETGSCAGEGIQRALDAGFKYVLSVEADPIFYNKCLHRFMTPAVYMFHGLSTDLLSKMLNKLEDDNPYVIFLDAHPAGPNTFGHNELMKDGDKSEYSQNSIITKELELILAHRNDHCIIIDDMNGMSEECKQYIDTLYKANPSYKFYFYDENLSGNHLYKNKSLVAIVE